MTDGWEKFIRSLVGKSFEIQHAKKENQKTKKKNEKMRPEMKGFWKTYDMTMVETKVMIHNELQLDNVDRCDGKYFSIKFLARFFSQFSLLF